MKYDVFISYRRDGGEGTAKHIYDLLTKDNYSVSYDVDTLGQGDFDTQIYKIIDDCQDFILILDKNAFDRTLDPLIPPENDWLRQELAYALSKGDDINIIPVMLRGFKFPEYLPKDIEKVTKKNAPEYNTTYFGSFYEKLKTFLNSVPTLDLPHTDIAQKNSWHKAIIRIKPDMDCLMTDSGEQVAILKGNANNDIPLLKGCYKLQFISTECSDDIIELIYEVEDNNMKKFLDVELCLVRDARLKALADNQEKVNAEHQRKREYNARIEQYLENKGKIFRNEEILLFNPCWDFVLPLSPVLMYGIIADGLNVIPNVLIIITSFLFSFCFVFFLAIFPCDLAENTKLRPIGNALSLLFFKLYFFKKGPYPLFLEYILMLLIPIIDTVIFAIISISLLGLCESYLFKSITDFRPLLISVAVYLCFKLWISIQFLRTKPKK